MNKAPHVLIKDDDDHWFLIPEVSQKHFRHCVEINDWKVIDRMYSEFAIDNPLNLVIFDWKNKNERD